jgi:hypothetical protein
VAGRESRRGECQNAGGFCFGAKPALETERPTEPRPSGDHPSAAEWKKEAQLPLGFSPIGQVGNVTGNSTQNQSLATKTKLPQPKDGHSQLPSRLKG